MVTVVTDSVACLSPELRTRLGIAMVGIPMTLEGTQYRDGVDLTAAEFYARMGETITHKTAALSVGDWLDTLQPAVDAGATACWFSRCRDGSAVPSTAPAPRPGSWMSQQPLSIR